MHLKVFVYGFVAAAAAGVLAASLVVFLHDTPILKGVAVDQGRFVLKSPKLDGQPFVVRMNTKTGECWELVKADNGRAAWHQIETRPPAK